MKAEVKKLLLDINEAISSIDSYLGENKDFKIIFRKRWLEELLNEN